MAHFLQKSKFIYCVCTLCPIENQTNVFFFLLNIFIEHLTQLFDNKLRKYKAFTLLFDNKLQEYNAFYL